jgi:hypothetical protein
MRALIVPLIALLAAACASSSPPAAAGPIEVRDAAPYPDDDLAGVARGDTCSIAARRLWECGCPEVRKLPYGMTFPDYCRDMGPALATDCIAANRACGDLSKCHVRCLR